MRSRGPDTEHRPATRLMKRAFSALRSLGKPWVTFDLSAEAAIAGEEQAPPGIQRPAAPLPVCSAASKGARGNSANSASSLMKCRHRFARRQTAQAACASLRAPGTASSKSAQRGKRFPHGASERRFQLARSASQSGSRSRTKSCIQRSRFSSISTAGSSISRQLLSRQAAESRWLRSAPHRPRRSVPVCVARRGDRVPLAAC